MAKPTTSMSKEQDTYRRRYNIREATPTEIERMSPLCRYWYRVWGRIQFDTRRDCMPPPIYQFEGKYAPTLWGIANMSTRAPRHWSLRPVQPDVGETEWLGAGPDVPEFSEAHERETLDLLQRKWAQWNRVFRYSWPRRKRPRYRYLAREFCHRAFGYRTSIAVYTPETTTNEPSTT